MTTRMLGTHATWPGAAGLLGLAATPVFAAMALLSAIPGGTHAALCGGMPDALSAGGMALMYLLMSVFHSAPWLRMIGRR